MSKLAAAIKVLLLGSTVVLSTLSNASTPLGMGVEPPVLRPLSCEVAFFRRLLPRLRFPCQHWNHCVRIDRCEPPVWFYSPQFPLPKPWDMRH